MLKLFQEWGEENDGGGEFNYDIYYKNFCKCHNVPPAHSSIIIKNKVKK
jgi:hypothetical protein